MAIRTLEQVLSQLGSVYDPQINNIRQQQALIPQQIQDEEKGLQARQDQAFGDILGGARRRGLGFSGIPLQDQAKYTSTEFLPALARLRQQGRQQAMSLEDAILGINERRNTQALQLRQADIDNDYRERQFAEDVRRYNEQIAEQRRQAAAASAGNYGSMFTGGGGSPAQSGGGGASATARQRADKGFEFTDQNGTPISAAQYAIAKGIPFRQLLQTMANQGDAGAKSALQFVGNDFGYDPRKVNNQSLANLYNSLVWGTGKSAKASNVSVASPGQRIVVPGYQPSTLKVVNR